MLAGQIFQGGLEAGQVREPDEDVKRGHVRFDGLPDKLAVVAARFLEEPTAGLDPLAEVRPEAPGRLCADQVVSEAAGGGQARPGEHLVPGTTPGKRHLRGRVAFEPSALFRSRKTRPPPQSCWGFRPRDARSRFSRLPPSLPVVAL